MSDQFLTEEQKNEFEINGYLILNKWWDDVTVKKLRNKVFEILKNEDLSTVKSVFTTKEQDRETDNYFLTSGREVRFFWEEKANGKINVDPINAINKIGHGLHDLVPEFESISYDSRIASICKGKNCVKEFELLQIQNIMLFIS